MVLARVLEEVGKASAGIGFVLSNTISPFIPVALEDNQKEKTFSEFSEIFCKIDEAKVCSLILPDYGELDGRTEDDFLGRTVQVSAEPKIDEYVIYGEEVRPINSAHMGPILCDM